MRGARGRGGDRDRLAPGPEIRGNFRFARIPYAGMLDDIHEIVRRRVTPEELKAPTPELVMEVIGGFIREILNKTREQMTPAVTLMDQLDYPELYDSMASSQMIFLHHATQLLELSGFGPFGIRDLFAPDKVRFHYQLSALVNFARFKVARQRDFVKLTDQTEAETAQLRTLGEEKTKLEAEVAKIEAERERDRPQVDALKAEITEKAEKLAAQVKQQKELTEQTLERKAVLKRLTDENEALQLTESEERAEVERMESKVVASPARVRAELDAMDAKLDANLEHKAGVLLRTKSLEAREDAVSTVGVQCTNLQHLNSDTVNKLRALHHVHANMQRLATKKAEVDTENMASEELKLRIRREMASLDARIARVVEQKQGIHNRSTDDERERMERLAAVRKRLDDLRKASEDKAAVAQKTQADIVRTAQEADELYAAFEQQVNALLTTRLSLNQDVDKTVEVYAAIDREGQQKYEMLLKSLEPLRDSK